ncbi:MAG: ribose-5-phosphate isomerase RpiA [Candidatus Bathyarchaeota archaeon]|jgi:ribose 5-phosphate isomerase A
MSWIDSAKRRAAEAAITHVKNNSVIGLGSGSTTEHFIRVLGTLIESGELKDIKGVPTSYQTATEAMRAGIQLTTLDENPELEIAIDGADQIDRNLDAIKGGGGALLREKIVASTSKSYILIVDERKLTKQLGLGTPLPLEILPFSVATIAKRVENLGAKVSLRAGTGKLGPVVTDNGNFILDAEFGPIEDPLGLDEKLSGIPGILETGFFLGLANVAYIGTRESVEILERDRDQIN